MFSAWATVNLCSIFLQVQLKLDGLILLPTIPCPLSSTITCYNKWFKSTRFCLILKGSCLFFFLSFLFEVIFVERRCLIQEHFTFQKEVTKNNSSLIVSSVWLLRTEFQLHSSFHSLLWNFEACESYHRRLPPLPPPPHPPKRVDLQNTASQTHFEQHQWRWPLNSRVHAAVAMLQTLFNTKSDDPALFSLSSSVRESFGATVMGNVAISDVLCA